jgi:hypothetical protein
MGGGGSAPVGSMGGVQAPSGAGGAGGAGGGSGEESDCAGISGGFGGDMNCSEGGGGAGGVGEFPGEGDAEALGEELDESIGGFDETLGEEQRQVSSVGRNTEGFGTGGSGGGSGGGISLGEQSEGAMGSGSGSGGFPGGQQSQSASPIEQMSEEQIAARTPDDIEILVDDDIIAKQLREAALAEEDPELRERLWEEYRKYRGIN